MCMYVSEREVEVETSLCMYVCIREGSGGGDIVMYVCMYQRRKWRWRHHYAHIGNEVKYLNAQQN